jgi:hypothetical protein
MTFPRKNLKELRVDNENIAIKEVDECKYLGIILDSELEWTGRIDQVYKKLVKFVGMLYKLRSKPPPAVCPLILYGIEICAKAHTSYLNKLEKLNNKILWILI